MQKPQQRSKNRKLASGKLVSYPTLDDFVQALVASKDIKDEADLRRHPEYYAEIFKAWIRSAQLGCLFAVQMAGQSVTEASWLTIVMESFEAKDPFHQRLNQILRAAQAPDALTILFPSVTTPEGVVDLLNILCTDAAWGWEEIPCDDKARLLVGLRWMLPAGGSASWALGFGPFDFMPFTRQSPLSAIVLRTQYSARRPPAGELDYVHLADLPPYSRGASPELWPATKQLKKELLPDEKERACAKAKVTFTLPMTLKNKIPAPKSYRWAKQEKSVGDM